jgi:hypothetical protein
MIGIPGIRARDTKAAAWYIEDYIEGRLATITDVAEFVTDHAAAFWLPTARLRRIKLPFQLRLIEALERSLAPAFPAVAEDALWPVGFGHNDLMSGNLLRDAEGKFWLVDWEGAGIMPLVADLGSVYLDVPHLADTILALLAAADPSGRALAPRHQLALGASLALQKRAEGRRDFVADAKRRGISETEALRLFNGRIDNYRRVIVQLAG